MRQHAQAVMEHIRGLEFIPEEAEVLIGEIRARVRDVKCICGAQKSRAEVCPMHPDDTWYADY